ncbi:uncharacterized protein I303_107695 [Kwoniella dejecticola CBS 10117]|uniref:YDG domain-containing protein n=1 Tax=Kwoniella dejecticola CBS 10117 TaxID=1296121 RepID=A0A1A5ZVG3_9TREE|nr:uncharacterized protein I303_07704 [Kwoniella dejecticola CBS 10117]OBR81794.1 hypothetical protein I303_07704 [Kwoniella dejecticola CBS 10117]
MSLSYEEQRIQNIKDNEALLLSLGLGAPIIPKAPKKAVLEKKKKNNDDGTFKHETTPQLPRIKKPMIRDVEVSTPGSTSTSGGANGLRRSGRSSVGGSTPDYKGDSPLWREDAIVRSKSLKRSFSTREVDSDEEDQDENDWRQRKAQKLGIRTADPKTFGSIPGVEVGRCWATRMECSTDAIHAPTVAGISGNALEGAWSVALSGGYPDDVDLGYAFTYTGSGGRDLKGTKQNPKNLRTAEQSYDQSFDNRFNAALKKSSETRKPVRVIRGFKLPSVYAPAEGYRYDGLYTVEKAWMARGLTKGLKVCRYAFKRVEGQEPLPVRVGDDEEEVGIEPESGEDMKEGLKREAKPREDLILHELDENVELHTKVDEARKVELNEDEDGKANEGTTLKKAIKSLRKVIEVVIPSRSASTSASLDHEVKREKRRASADEDTDKASAAEQKMGRRTSVRRSP